MKLLWGTTFTESFAVLVIRRRRCRSKGIALMCMRLGKNIRTLRWYFPRTWIRFLRSFLRRKMRAGFMDADRATRRASSQRKWRLRNDCASRTFMLGFCFWWEKSATVWALAWRMNMPRTARVRDAASWSTANRQRITSRSRRKGRCALRLLQPDAIRSGGWTMHAEYWIDRRWARSERDS